jgi:hypothetical protein
MTNGGDGLRRNRTQEVAGSSPASSIPEAACNSSNERCGARAVTPRPDHAQQATMKKKTLPGVRSLVVLLMIVTESVSDPSLRSAPSFRSRPWQ